MAQAGFVSATGHSNVLFLVVPRVFIINLFDSSKSLKGVTGQNEHRHARIAGLQHDLKMTNKQYSIALTVTYVPYIAAELPSNLLLRVRRYAYF